MAATDRPDVVLRRREILVQIAGGRTPAETAAALGLSVRTVYRALRNPEVQAALDQLHSERMQALLDASLDLAPEAFTTLRMVMDSPIVSPTAKVAAARAALTTLTFIVPLADTERRIAALEQRAHAGGQGELLALSPEWRRFVPVEANTTPRESEEGAPR